MRELVAVRDMTMRNDEARSIHERVFNDRMIDATRAGS